MHLLLQTCGEAKRKLLQDFPEAKNLPSSSLGRFEVTVAQFRGGSCRAHLATHLNGSLWHYELKIDIAESSGEESSMRTWKSKAVFLDFFFFLENFWLNLKSEMILWTESASEPELWKAKLLEA